METDRIDITAQLFALQDKAYADFQSKLMPTVPRETEITAGTYPIVQGSDLSNPYMTVHASEGIIAGFTTPSYAGYLNANSELMTPVWYIMAGTVIIDEKGRIEVTAINSAERTVHCVLRGKLQGLEEIVHRPSSIRKFVKDGLIYIQRGEQIYDVTGKELR